MKDNIEYRESELLSISRSLQRTADEIGSATSNLSTARALMDAMPGLMCSFAFGMLNPVFTIVSLVRRGVQTGTVIYALTCANQQIRNLQDNIQELVRRIRRANEQFLNTELKLTSHFTSGGATDDPFDLNGQNGGDQGLTRQREGQSTSNPIDKQYYDSYRDIIERNTGRKLTDPELQVYLDQMNRCGCSYVALMNAILAEYKDRPAEFERKFGVPLYRDGDFNYDQILVDFYSAIDRPGNPIAPWKNTGSNAGSMDEYMKRYFDAKGLDCPKVTYEKKIITADDYRRMISSGDVKEGQLLISIGDPMYMRRQDGTLDHNFNRDGAHSMTVIGTDGDRLIVSTWGDGATYYVDPADYVNYHNDYFYVTKVQF